MKLNYLNTSLAPTDLDFLLSFFSGNEVPTIEVVSGLDTVDNQTILYANQNQPLSFVLTANDDGTVKYEFLDNTFGAELSTPNAEGNVLVNVTLTDTTTGNLR